MPSRSELESHSRLVLGFGLIGLAAVWLLRLLWPLFLLLLLAGLGVGCYQLWQQHQAALLQQQRREERLAGKFYELLDCRQGRISSLEFAMHSRVSGREAQRYLHAQAQAFGGFFERTVQNDIVYLFNPAVVYSYVPQPSDSPAELAWAYAEQVRMQRLYQQSQSRYRASAQPSYAQPRSSMSRVRSSAAYSDDEHITTIDVSAVNES